MKETILKWLNFGLMIDLFFVLVSFFWFAVALVGRSLDVPLGFDVWYRLWDSLFMPAIGLLMAGSLTVGIVRWVSNKIQKFSSLDG
ncbi:MAG: hypothetical protein AAGA75_04190 [Cyanobacteria bacterium P01_E01_bin.6]